MIRKIAQSDRRDYLQMTQEFYNSDAVIAPIPAKYRENTFEELMKGNPFLDSYILEREGKTAGYALLNFSWSQEAGGQVVWIEELYVLPEYQNQGLGKEFFAFFQKQFPETARYRLEVEPENENAVHLYQKIGFKELPYGQMIKDNLPAK